MVNGKPNLAGSRARDFSRGTSYDSIADVDALKPPRNVLAGSTSTLLRPDSQLEDRPYSRQSIASVRTLGARSTTSLMMDGGPRKSIDKPVVLKMLRCVQAQRKWFAKLLFRKKNYVKLTKQLFVKINLNCSVK